MRITREEFKGFIAEYEELYQWYCDYEDILTERVLDVITKPMNYIGKLIGARYEFDDEDVDIAFEYILRGNFMGEEDLDIIYDKYINKLEELENE